MTSPYVILVILYRATMLGLSQSGDPLTPLCCVCALAITPIRSGAHGPPGSWLHGLLLGQQVTDPNTTSIQY